MLSGAWRACRAGDRWRHAAGRQLMPGPSDAAWIAQFGARRLMAHLKDGKSARKALRSALADAEKSFEALRRHPPEEKWQMPCASMIAWPSGRRCSGGKLEISVVRRLRRAGRTGRAAVDGGGRDLRQARRRSGTRPHHRKREKSPARFRPQPAGIHRRFAQPRAIASTAATTGCSARMRGRRPMSRAGSSRWRRATRAAAGVRRFSGPGQRLWRLQRRQPDGGGADEGSGGAGRRIARHRSTAIPAATNIRASRSQRRCDGAFAERSADQLFMTVMSPPCQIIDSGDIETISQAAHS